MLETRRLRLRAYRDVDLDPLVSMIGNWEVARWLGQLPHPYGVADGREWIKFVQREHQGPQPRRFAVALRESDALIGGIGFVGAEVDGAAEIGYWLGQPHWGQGFGREAAAAIIDYGFRELSLQTIRAKTDPANFASQKVLLACGLEPSGEIGLGQPTRHSGAMHALSFSLARDRWR